MRKFNPEKELQKVQNNKKNVNSSKLSNMYVPLLIIACSCLAMVGITFSANLADSSKNEYVVRIDIINGNEDSYVKKVKEGAFSDTILSNNSFGSIKCSSGNLSYNPDTNVISAPYVNQNTSCVLVFMDDVVKDIKYEDLNSITDNTGISYYYKADSKDNYIKIKDMMFRIVRINGDGSYRLILNDSVLASDYGTSLDFIDSNVRATLNNWFESNFANEEYVVDGDFDITNYAEINYKNLLNDEGFGFFKVGTLSVNEVDLITKDVEEPGYLSNMYLMNYNGIGKIFAYLDGQITSVTPDTRLTLRPVINVVGELEGTGTINNPYVLK